MPQQWYYQQMGEVVGPVSGAQLRRLAKSGEIQPDTRVRLGGTDGWYSADRVKGLFPPPPKAPPPPMPKPAPPVEITPVEPEDKPETYALRMGASAETAFQSPAETATGGIPTSVEGSDADDYDLEFFEFVGFENAISTPLFEAVKAYIADHGLTMSQVTRKALAQFIGKPELGKDQS
jgi:hypothetical protein